MEFYKSISKFYDDIFPLNKSQVSFITENLENDLSDKHLLDIGCGTGNLSIALSNLGMQVTGIDLDEEMIQFAELKNKEHNIRFQVMDMTLMGKSFEENSFDIICCFGNTLVHLLELDIVSRFLNDCRKALKPKGKLLIQILNYDHIITNQITELPLIENNMLKFERYYKNVKVGVMFDFKTILNIKDTGQKIENNIPLYPIRKNEIDKELRNSGFLKIEYFSAFDRTNYIPESLPLIIEAEY